ncbi:MAG: AMP-binding protein, partial [Desulfitobacterium sp.]|nr:AMP-binding protein [Desulfitobacterium sp.]
MKKEKIISDLPWLAQYDPQVPHTLEYPEETVDALVRKSIKNHPQEIALIYFGYKMTYGELGKKIDQFAGALKNLGIKPGDKVALLMANCPQFVISFYGILSLGAIAVPVNPLSTESELLHIFRDSQVKMVVSLDLLAERLENVRDTLHQGGETHILVHSYYTSLNEYMKFPLKFLYLLTRKLTPGAKARLKVAKRFKELFASNISPLTEYPSQKMDVYKDLAVLIYTGGTTGRSKGVMLSHYGLVANGLQAISWVKMGKRD